MPLLVTYSSTGRTRKTNRCPFLLHIHQLVEPEKQIDAPSCYISINWSNPKNKSMPLLVRYPSTGRTRKTNRCPFLLHIHQLVEPEKQIDAPSCYIFINWSNPKNKSMPLLVTYPSTG